MENISRKCYSAEHYEFDAVSFCQECRIYMCNKCYIFHIEKFKNHNIINSDKNISDIFTGYCQIKNHQQVELIYFCKDHNQLCCACCISKIKSKDYGQHSDCDVCTVEEIINEKKNNLSKNIESLEDMSINLNKIITELKSTIKYANEKKEALKLEISQIFTKIRNKINEREDELFVEIDNIFSELYSDEGIIKRSEKLPNKVKQSLEKGKIIEKDWNNYSLTFLINDCINIENNIKDIEKLNDINFNADYNFKFNHDLKELITKIDSFGWIEYKNKFAFKKYGRFFCDNHFEISGDYNNIITKKRNKNNNPFFYCNYYRGIICEGELEKNKIHKWKITILKSKEKKIIVGISLTNVPVDSDDYRNYGWHFNCNDLKLYSCNKDGEFSFLSEVKNDIIIVFNSYIGTLKFIINDEDKGDSFINIPLDKPLTPIVFLSDENDSVMINKYIDN